MTARQRSAAARPYLVKTIWILLIWTAVLGAACGLTYLIKHLH